MTRRAPIAAAVAVVAAIGAAGWNAAAQQATDVESLTFLGKTVTAAQLVLGQEDYAANCASCHGANLEGQPDWRRRNENGRMPAPPHDANGHTWHHADRQLFTITKLGVSAIVPGYESDMPAFEGILSDDEIVAVLAFIKSTWPERERGFQAEVTANDEGGS
ncbi:c-type cytochrome [Nisaea denitrificans]|uniref:c-type cytochrome n=1 Tax=Nisaea denitrificans TaxID=390877 RepID=UPI0004159E48|nr:cytochrome c [Nisaea denitrificans]|tara:strand:+ start:9591 stop:10076 length:486 start_codon:yes stop_codon:yes gene_type:complete